MNRNLLSSLLTIGVLITTQSYCLSSVHKKNNIFLSNFRSLTKSWKKYVFPWRSITFDGWYTSKDPTIYNGKNIYLLRDINSNPKNIFSFSKSKINNILETEKDNKSAIENVHWSQLSKSEKENIDIQVMQQSNNSWKIHLNNSIRWCYLSPDKKRRAWLILYSPLATHKPYVDQFSIWIEKVANSQIYCIGTLKVKDFVKEFPDQITWLPDSSRISLVSNNILFISPSLKQY